MKYSYIVYKIISTYEETLEKPIVCFSDLEKAREFAEKARNINYFFVEIKKLIKNSKYMSFLVDKEFCDYGCEDCSYEIKQVFQID